MRKKFALNNKKINDPSAQFIAELGHMSSNQFMPDNKLVPSSKRGSISWECLPFASKKTKSHSKSKGKGEVEERGDSRHSSHMLPPKSTPSKSRNEVSIRVNPNETMIPIATAHTTITSAMITSSSSKMNSSSLHSSMSSIAQHSSSKASSSKKQQSAGPTLAQIASQKTQQKEQQQPDKHQPYSTSLVNSGFGFGFDLQGGDNDNQLTFIVNVHPNGDAARKGLTDGDILVSIQGKNVIGLKRVAIERILKQYKVDQEIEIVVCRLKDPNLLLSLAPPLTPAQSVSKTSPPPPQPLITSSSHSSITHSKRKSPPVELTTTSSSSSANLASSRHASNSFDINRYRSLSQQIFKELVTFQDPSYSQNSRPTKFIETNPKNQNVYVNQKIPITKYTEMSSACNDFDENLISIELKPPRPPTQNEVGTVEGKGHRKRKDTKSANHASAVVSSSTMSTGSTSSSSSASPPPVKQSPINTTSLSPGAVINSALNSNRTAPTVNLRPTMEPQRRAASQHHSSISHRQPQNSVQYSFDSGFIDSSRRSNKSSFYSDISIILYDNIDAINLMKSGRASHPPPPIAGSSSDIVVVSMNSHQHNQHSMQSQHQPTQLNKHSSYHNIQPPMPIEQFNSKYVPKNLLPLSISHHAATVVSSTGTIVSSPNAVNTASGPGARTQSYNDFTGSILQAERVNFINKQHSQNSTPKSHSLKQAQSQHQSTRINVNPRSSQLVHERSASEHPNDFVFERVMEYERNILAKKQGGVETENVVKAQKISGRMPGIAIVEDSVEIRRTDLINTTMLTETFTTTTTTTSANVGKVTTSDVKSANQEDTSLMLSTSSSSGSSSATSFHEPGSNVVIENLAHSPKSLHKKMNRSANSELEIPINIQLKPPPLPPKQPQLLKEDENENSKSNKVTRGQKSRFNMSNTQECSSSIVSEHQTFTTSSSSIDIEIYDSYKNTSSTTTSIFKSKKQKPYRIECQHSEMICDEELTHEEEANATSHIKSHSSLIYIDDETLAVQAKQIVEADKPTVDQIESVKPEDNKIEIEIKMEDQSEVEVPPVAAVVNKTERNVIKKRKQQRTSAHNDMLRKRSLTLENMMLAAECSPTQTEPANNSVGNKRFSRRDRKHRHTLPIALENKIYNHTFAKPQAKAVNPSTSSEEDEAVKPVVSMEAFDESMKKVSEWAKKSAESLHPVDPTDTTIEDNVKLEDIEQEKNEQVDQEGVEAKTVKSDEEDILGGYKSPTGEYVSSQNEYEGDEDDYEGHTDNMSCSTRRPVVVDEAENNKPDELLANLSSIEPDRKEDKSVEETEPITCLEQQVPESKTIDAEESEYDSIPICSLANIKPRRDHSTDTIDSTSSYEIRFERPHLPPNSAADELARHQQRQQTLREKLMEKNAQWNIIISNDMEEEGKKMASSPKSTEMEAEEKQAEQELPSEKQPVEHQAEMIVDNQVQIEEQVEHEPIEVVPATIERELVESEQELSSPDAVDVIDSVVLESKQEELKELVSEVIDDMSILPSGLSRSYTSGEDNDNSFSCSTQIPAQEIVADIPLPDLSHVVMLPEIESVQETEQVESTTLVQEIEEVSVKQEEPEAMADSDVSTESIEEPQSSDEIVELQSDDKETIETAETVNNIETEPSPNVVDDISVDVLNTVESIIAECINNSSTNSPQRFKSESVDEHLIDVSEFIENNQSMLFDNQVSSDLIQSSVPASSMDKAATESESYSSSTDSIMKDQQPDVKSIFVESSSLLLLPETGVKSNTSLTNSVEAETETDELSGISKPSMSSIANSDQIRPGNNDETAASSGNDIKNKNVMAVVQSDDAGYGSSSMASIKNNPTTHESYSSIDESSIISDSYLNTRLLDQQQMELIQKIVELVEDQQPSEEHQEGIENNTDGDVSSSDEHPPISVTYSLLDKVDLDVDLTHLDDNKSIISEIKESNRTESVSSDNSIQQIKDTTKAVEVELDKNVENHQEIIASISSHADEAVEITEASLGDQLESKLADSAQIESSNLDTVNVEQPPNVLETSSVSVEDETPAEVKEETLDKIDDIVNQVDEIIEDSKPVEEPKEVEPLVEGTESIVEESEKVQIVEEPVQVEIESEKASEPIVEIQDIEKPEESEIVLEQGIDQVAEEVKPLEAIESTVDEHCNLVGSELPSDETNELKIEPSTEKALDLEDNSINLTFIEHEIVEPVSIQAIEDVIVDSSSKEVAIDVPKAELPSESVIITESSQRPLGRSPAVSPRQKTKIEIPTETQEPSLKTQDSEYIATESKVQIEEEEKNQIPEYSLPRVPPPTSPVRRAQNDEVRVETVQTKDSCRLRKPEQVVNTPVTSAANIVPEPISPTRSTEKFIHGRGDHTISSRFSHSQSPPPPFVRTASSSVVIISSTAPVNASYSSKNEFKSTITPRPNVICRRPMASNTHSQSYSSNKHTSNSSYANHRQSVVPYSPNVQTVALRQTHHKEKQQLSELNDRFATYIERVRFLEVQNKYLDREVTSLRAKLGLETKEIESMYKIELDAAKNILEEVTDEKHTIRQRLERTEKELIVVRRRHDEIQTNINQDRQKIRELLDQLAENEAEIGLLKRRLTDLHDEEKRLKMETIRMSEEVQRVTMDLESEINHRIMLENDKQALEEQLAFMKQMHSKELDDLKNQAFKTTGINPEEFFRNELTNAIREIRREYENASLAQRSEMDRSYRIKVADIRRKNASNAVAIAGDNDLDREQARKVRLQISESKRGVYDLRIKNAELESRIKHLEEEIKREESETKEIIANKEENIKLLKDQLEDITINYEDLMSNLENEISTYKNLLEGFETAGERQEGLRQIIEKVEKRHQVPPQLAISSGQYTARRPVNALHHHRPPPPIPLSRQLRAPSLVASHTRCSNLSSMMYKHRQIATTFDSSYSRTTHL